MSNFMCVPCTSSSSQPHKPGGSLIKERALEVGCGRGAGSKWALPRGSKDSLLCGEGMTGGDQSQLTQAQGIGHHLLVKRIDASYQ